MGRGWKTEVQSIFVMKISLFSSGSLNPHLYYEGLDWIISKLYYNTKVPELYDCIGSIS